MNLIAFVMLQIKLSINLIYARTDEYPLRYWKGPTEKVWTTDKCKTLETKTYIGDRRYYVWICKLNCLSEKECNAIEFEIGIFGGIFGNKCMLKGCDFPVPEPDVNKGRKGYFLESGCPKNKLKGNNIGDEDDLFFAIRKGAKFYTDGPSKSVTAFPSFLNEGFFKKQPGILLGKNEVITIDVAGGVSVYVGIMVVNNFLFSGGFEKTLPQVGWKKETGEIILGSGFVLGAIYSKSFDKEIQISLPAMTTDRTIMVIIVVSICQDQSSSTTPAITSSTSSTPKITPLPETSITPKPEDASIMSGTTSSGSVSNQTEETLPNVSSSIFTLTSSTTVASNPASTKSICTDEKLEVTPAKDEVTALTNGDMKLTCSTNNNWKRCSWIYNGKRCTFEYVFDEVQWKYDEVECDADFGDHEFLKPDPEISDMGNNNTECGIKMKEMALYQSGKYQCKFQKCNKEEYNMCKTNISKDCKLFSATINLKVEDPPPLASVDPLLESCACKLNNEKGSFSKTWMNVVQILFMLFTIKNQMM